MVGVNDCGSELELDPKFLEHDRNRREPGCRVRRGGNRYWKFAAGVEARGLTIGRGEVRLGEYRHQTFLCQGIEGRCEAPIATANCELKQVLRSDLAPGERVLCCNP